MSRRWSWAAVAFLAIAAGCKSADDEYEPAFVPKEVKFEGNVDEKYVGFWDAPDGSGSLDLSKDGTVNIVTNVSTPQGKSSSKVNGKWLASGSALVFQYKDPSQKDTTVKYAADLKGDTLVLGTKVKTTYKKK